MEAAIADVDQLGRAGADAQSRLGVLEALAGHAGNTLAGVKASMSALERAANESEVTAELVADLADRAGGVVGETVHGIESLRAAVADAHRRVSALGRRSDDIDQVVDFISEVAGRTNLLSLNASIIAAQAGEHGKPFGVVADQIRELAAQIARSTKSIGDIIHSVREDVEATAALIERGDTLASDGVRLARGSLEALSGIRRSTVHARDTAVAIRMAVDSHAQSSGEVSKLVESVADGSKAVAGAVQLVGRGRPRPPGSGRAWEAAERERRPPGADARGHRARGGRPRRRQPAGAGRPPRPRAVRRAARGGGGGARGGGGPDRLGGAGARRARGSLQAAVGARAYLPPGAGMSRG